MLTVWRPIKSAPTDGTRIRVHRRLNRYSWEGPCVGHYKEMPDGFKGWWNDAGEYLSPHPDSWLPLESDMLH